MLECVINISEGRDLSLIDDLGSSAGQSLLDIHSDADHNRSVFTLAGPAVKADARALTTTAVSSLDIRNHDGVHPRIGVVDVVPFIPLQDSSWEEATAARDSFAQWAASELQIPTFVYGNERSLPDIRKQRFGILSPTYGPALAHSTAGAIAVGVRDVLVAYNLVISGTIEDANSIARQLRSTSVRALGLQLKDGAQVSFNLIQPYTTGPIDVFEAVNKLSTVVRAELVGLLPRSVLEQQPRERWEELDLGIDKTIEARLADANRAS